MVVLTDNFVAQQRARRVAHRLGVPEEVLSAADMAHPDLDWRELVFALDGIFLAHGSEMAQARFLRMRNPELQGQSPLEALVGDDGPQRVRRAAVASAAQRRIIG